LSAIGIPASAYASTGRFAAKYRFYSFNPKSDINSTL
jgi:hypothetical protein